MGSKLAAFVHVHDENGETHVFGPEDSVPGWARKAITNPAAWAAGDDEDGDAAPSRPAKNAGKDKWAAYAQSIGVDLTGVDDNKDAVVTAVEAKEAADKAAADGQ